MLQSFDLYSKSVAYKVKWKDDDADDPGDDPVLLRQVVYQLHTLTCTVGNISTKY